MVISHWKWVTGSLCDFSTWDIATGSAPALESQIPTIPLAQPAPIISVSLWLYDKFVNGDGEFKLISGVFGFYKSQTYEHVLILSGVCWKRGIAYETASLFGPSTCQLISLTDLLQMSFGSLKSINVFVEIFYTTWSDSSFRKYSWNMSIWLFLSIHF